MGTGEVEYPKSAAIVLAAGRGSRMNSDTPKQYMLLNGKPLLAYSLEAFERSFVDEVVLVVSAGEEAYCRDTVVEPGGFAKVRRIVPGGKERYHSVARGLEAVSPNAEYIFIHDGARPFLTQEILADALAAVRETKAAAAGMPVKDTIKLTDEQGYVMATPPRNRLWQVQTPQVFEAALIRRAYAMLLKQEEELSRDNVRITDDAMVAELMLQAPVRLFPASYRNIKITTREDLLLAESLLRQ